MGYYYDPTGAGGNVYAGGFTAPRPQPVQTAPQQPQPQQPQQPAQQPPAYGAPAAPSQSSWFATPAAAAAPVAAPRNPEWDAFYNQLKGRSTQSLAFDPRTDPIVRAQTDAYRAEQERSRNQDLAALAEKAGPNTNLRAEGRAAAEQTGQATSAYQANLSGAEVAARRAEIAQALTLQQGQLTTEEASRLRQEDQALQARAQDLQNSQFGANLNQQESQFGRTFGLASRQQDWMQAFQDRGWDADQAQRAWDADYKRLQLIFGY